MSKKAIKFCSISSPVTEDVLFYPTTARVAKAMIVMHYSTPPKGINLYYYIKEILEVGEKIGVTNWEKISLKFLLRI